MDFAQKQKIAQKQANFSCFELRLVFLFLSQSRLRSNLYISQSLISAGVGIQELFLLAIPGILLATATIPFLFRNPLPQGFGMAFLQKFATLDWIWKLGFCWIGWWSRKPDLSMRCLGEKMLGNLFVSCLGEKKLGNFFVRCLGEKMLGRPWRGGQRLRCKSGWPLSRGSGFSDGDCERGIARF